jgi:hypothetical protein
MVRAPYDGGAAGDGDAARPAHAGKPAADVEGVHTGWAPTKPKLAARVIANLDHAGTPEVGRDGGSRLIWGADPEAEGKPSTVLMGRRGAGRSVRLRRSDGGGQGEQER